MNERKMYRIFRSLGKDGITYNVGWYGKLTVMDFLWSAVRHLRRPDMTFIFQSEKQFLTDGFYIFKAEWHDEGPFCGLEEYNLPANKDWLNMNVEKVIGKVKNGKETLYIKVKANDIL